MASSPANPINAPVIALVTSAGGLNALTQVLGPLPAHLPAAIIVVQHIDPDFDSSLPAILDDRTALNVRPATDGHLLIPGTVLVAPPGRHLLVTSEARVGLIDSGKFPPSRPSADLLLATLAVMCGPGALAVVLTGKGTDAQAGSARSATAAAPCSLKARPLLRISACPARRSTPASSTQSSRWTSWPMPCKNT
jgi:two-component system chemotaxis response regulator CheB